MSTQTSEQMKERRDFYHRLWCEEVRRANAAELLLIEAVDAAITDDWLLRARTIIGRSSIALKVKAVGRE
jgi:hypothetical protein